MKKITTLLFIILFTLAFSADAQNFGNLKNKVKKKVQESVEDVSNGSSSNSNTSESTTTIGNKIKGGWYVNHGLRNRTESYQYDIVGPKAIMEYENMGGKGELQSSTLVSKSKDPASFKPAMQYSELQSAIMEVDELPSIPKFYFSNKPINPNSPSSDTKTSFSNNEPVYCLVKYDRPLKDFYGADMSELDKNALFYITYTSTPDKLLESNPQYLRIPKEDMNKDYLVIDLIPSPSEATSDFKGATLAHFLYDNKSNMKNKPNSQYPVKSLSIEVEGWDKTVTNEVHIDVNSYDMSKIKSDVGNAQKQITANEVKQRGVPAKFTSATSKSEMLGYSKSELAKMCKQSHSGVAEIIDMKIIGNPRWAVWKNDYDIPEYQYVDGGGFSIVYKGANGNCYYVDYVSYIKDYQGGGRYGALQTPDTDKYIGEQINCDKIK